MILCDGCFDPVHLGHVQYLRAADGLRHMNEPLEIRIASDEELVSLKGRKSFQTLNERLTMLTNFVVCQTFTSETLVGAISTREPRLLVKGWDWIGKLPQDVIDACASVGAAIVYVPTQGRTSTERLNA